jgi:hypothetical protein
LPSIETPVEEPKEDFAPEDYDDAMTGGDADMSYLLY